MTITLCEVGIHALFTGNVQSIEKEQRGKYKGESRELRNAWETMVQSNYCIVQMRKLRPK